LPNLWGGRDIEYFWVAANTPEGPGEALDFGCGDGWLGRLAARKGSVTSVDLRTIALPFIHEETDREAGGGRDLAFKNGRFDLIFNCSAIEHVGLAGR
jgi:2-polyprenyl-3-methyl-5-hydroxy-6-metoxy-1,4-benzoquinol methylase